MKCILKVVCLGIVVMLISACSSLDIHGDWKLSKVENQGIVIEDEILEQSYGDDVIYTFGKNEEFSVKISGHKITGTYVQDGDHITIKQDGNEIELIYSNKYLVFDQDGVTYYLEKIE